MPPKTKHARATKKKPTATKKKKSAATKKKATALKKKKTVSTAIVFPAVPQGDPRLPSRADDDDVEARINMLKIQLKEKEVCRIERNRLRAILLALRQQRAAERRFEKLTDNGDDDDDGDEAVRPQRKEKAK
jgi:hypothetical protein